VRLADKIKHVEDHHLLELIRDTHKPSKSATPLIEPIAPAQAAAVNASSAGTESDVRAMSNDSPEPILPFPVDPQPPAFPLPLANVDTHHEQAQQEDYLWGV